MPSKCCDAGTRIGYYGTHERPDIHGAVHKDAGIFCVMGTYCEKCDKLCDFYHEETKIEYYTNGIEK